MAATRHLDRISGKTVFTNQVIANKANGITGLYLERRTTTEAYTATKQTMSSACLLHFLEYFKSFLMLRGSVKDNLQISSASGAKRCGSGQHLDTVDYWSITAVETSECDRI